MFLQHDCKAAVWPLPRQLHTDKCDSASERGLTLTKYGCLQTKALRRVCQKQLSMTVEAVFDCSAVADSISDDQLKSACKAFMAHPANRCDIHCSQQSAKTVPYACLNGTRAVPRGRSQQSAMTKTYFCLDTTKGCYHIPNVRDGMLSMWTSL